MKKYLFKKEWNRNVSTVSELATMLDVPLPLLKSVSSRADRHYRKKDIGTRTLLIPSRSLKAIQTKILKNLLNMDFDTCVQGGVKGRSIVVNARQHLGQKWVGCFDIKKFFPACHYSNIGRMYEALGCSVEVAEVLMHLTTFEYQLPQGSPVSPIISNLLVTDLDRRLSNLFKKAKFVYTRYFDDMTVSGNQDPIKYLSVIKAVVEQEGYKLHTSPKKLRMQNHKGEQRITGIIVSGSKLSLPPETMKLIEERISNYTKNLFDDDYLASPVKAKQSLRGYIDFLNSVDKTTANSFYEAYRAIKWPHEEVSRPKILV